MINLQENIVLENEVHIRNQGLIQENIGETELYGNKSNGKLYISKLHMFVFL